MLLRLPVYFVFVCALPFFKYERIAFAASNFYHPRRLTEGSLPCNKPSFFVRSNFQSAEPRKCRTSDIRRATASPPP